MRQLNHHTITPGITDLWVDCYDDNKRKVPATTAKAPDGTWLVLIDDNDPTPVGWGLNMRYRADGYKTTLIRQTMPPDDTQIEANAVVLEPSGTPFPPSGKRAPLPPFDASDSYGDVHTTPPPELTVPVGRDVLFMRADFNGVTLDTNRWGGTPPFLVGANSTPLAMLMTPMLALYPRKWQDACLTEHAERGYTHFVWDSHPWNLEENGQTFSVQQAKEWAAYLKSWGFYSVVWSGFPRVDDPMWAALVDAGLLDFAIIGEEVDGKFTSEQYAAVVTGLLAGPLNGIPAAAHFTSNYPVGFPRDTFLTNWADYNGRLHLCWQADPNDSAGRRGAMLYYARRRVALGQVGGDGRPAPNSRVYDFENQASFQLYGKVDEDRGNLQSLEDLYCPAPDAGVRGMSGFGNGCRKADGSVL